MGELSLEMSEVIKEGRHMLKDCKYIRITQMLRGIEEMMVEMTKILRYELRIVRTMCHIIFLSTLQISFQNLCRYGLIQG